MSEIKSSELSQRAGSAVLGGLVGDASSTGVHWIYGDDRVRQVVGNNPEFVEPNAKNYRPDGDYFAHKHKRAGDFTHYGEHALIVLRSLAENKGQFNLTHYSNLFKTHFGAGGEYIGYVDHAMRSTLYNMSTRESPASVLPLASFKGGAHVSDVGPETAMMLSYRMLPIIREHQNNTAELHSKITAFARTVKDSDIVVEYALQSADAFVALSKTPTGADDHQSNALAKIVPLVAAKSLSPAHYSGTSADFRAVLDSFIRVTQNNDLAVAYLLVAAFILELAVKGYTHKEAIVAAAVRLGLEQDPAVQVLLKDSALAAKVETVGKTEYQAGDSWAAFPEEVAKNVARAIQLAAETDDTVAVTGTFGRACYLRMTVPSSIHALLRAANYEDGVRRALLGGGDNSSRATFVGAVLGASLGYGTNGVPAEWIAKTRNATTAFSLLKEIQL